MASYIRVSYADQRSKEMDECSGFIGILGPDWLLLGNNGLADLEQAIDMDMPIVLVDQWEGNSFPVPEEFLRYKGPKILVTAEDMDDLQEQYIRFFDQFDFPKDEDGEPRLGLTM